MDTPRNRLLRKLRENQIRQKLEFEDSSKLAQLFPCNGATVDPFATDVVFGFHKPCGDASMQNENNWGFQVKEDGSVIYQQGNQQETYHVPHEAIDRLSNAFRPFYEMSFPDFVLNTGIQGLVEWCDSFTFLGYTFSAWCVDRQSLFNLDKRKGESEKSDNCKHALTMIDLFQKGCAILHDYGFDIDMQHFQKILSSN